MQHIEKLVPDTSVIIEGILSQKLKDEELQANEIIIHEAVLAELENQANQGKAIGLIGLNEIRKLKPYNLRFAGERPKQETIRYAKQGSIDYLIRELAFNEGATLVTADKIQARVAETKSIPILFIKPTKSSEELKLDEYFDATTMSVHLKENMPAFAKKGQPGNWKFEQVTKNNLTQDEIQDISQEIIEKTKIREDGFIEIERTGSTIIQLGHYRIVITKPPFSDCWEITAVKPVKQMNLEEYNLSEKLYLRIAEQAEGILIAGAPGHGKSTFAAALATYYASKGKIVKTIEAPRDLQLGDEITQYAISHADAQEIHDILLLSRPDYTIFDEMRNTKDFKLFADLRLAGIGLAGVVHATNPVDAIQRFLGRAELGVIPQIIDTVIFIKDGMINKVLSLNMCVKVPSGMTEADLARPIVEVADFETKKLEYEIYSYGEETVLVPVKNALYSSPTQNLAKKQIQKYFEKLSPHSKVEINSDHKAIVYVPENMIARIIGVKGANISKIEKNLGIALDIRALDETSLQEGDKQEISYEISETKKALIFKTSNEYAGKSADIYIEDNYFMTSIVSKDGDIKLTKKNKAVYTLISALNKNKRVSLKI